MRILAVINEHPLGSHPDVHEAFDRLVALGEIESYRSYPYLHKVMTGMSDEAIAEEILARVRDEGTEAVVWMHTRELRIRSQTIDAIRKMPGRPTMLYWEGDSYHPRYKPVPSPMLDLMSRCDVVLMPCGGPIVSVLQAAGCRDVRYAPSCASGTRFPRVWEPRERFDFDVVMIGNRVRSRRPFRTMPGAKRRALLVRKLMRRYGRRLALVGSGWSGPCALGPCEFDEQKELYAVSAVTVGVNNSDYPLVFSNRVPIAMACGIPLTYSRNPGFDRVFGRELDDVFFDDDDEAIASIDRLLSLGGEELAGLSQRNRQRFEADFARIVVARHAVSLAAAARARSLSDRAGLACATRTRRSAPRWQSIEPLVGQCDPTEPQST